MVGMYLHMAEPKVTCHTFSVSNICILGFSCHAKSTATNIEKPFRALTQDQGGAHYVANTCFLEIRPQDCENESGGFSVQYVEKEGTW
jgi:hypothetical protein